MADETILTKHLQGKGKRTSLTRRSSVDR